MEPIDTFFDYESGRINVREAAARLQISVSTFFRRYREYKENIGKIEKNNAILLLK